MVFVFLNFEQFFFYFLNRLICFCMFSKDLQNKYSFDPSAGDRLAFSITRGALIRPDETAIMQLRLRRTSC